MLALHLEPQTTCQVLVEAAKNLPAGSDTATIVADSELETHAVASRYLQSGFGGMVVFGVQGGYPASVKVIDNIKLFSHLANVGDARSLILHPASTSHSQLSEEQQRESGLTPDLVRLSIGFEHVDDLIAALDDALALT
jgi:O-acetylhomoserine (thiol)-lyase